MSKQTVAEAAKGDTRGLLVAMRDRVALAVSDPDCPARDLAALTKRLQDIVRDIELIDAAEESEHEQTGGKLINVNFDASAI